MGLFNKFKGMVHISEEEYYDDVDEIDEDEDDEEEDVRSNFSFNRRGERDGKVVDIRSSVPSQTGAVKAKVVIVRAEQYDGSIAKIADLINEKIIVSLNLETCGRETAVKILDFISGVAYANDAKLTRTAARSYVITPHNVALSGEIADDTEQIIF